MKIKVFAFVLIALFPSFLRAQSTDDYYALLYDQKEERSFMIINLGYDYSVTHASSVSTDMSYMLKATKWLDWQIGVRVSSRDLYQARTEFNFKWQVGNNPYRTMGFKNQYTYSAFAVDNFQQFNILLAAEYDQNYFYASLGAYGQMFGNFVPSRGEGLKYIWEPGLFYDIRGMVRPKNDVWNLGLQISNARRFMVDRMFMPQFTIFGYYRILGADTDHLKLLFEVGSQPAGIFNIAVNNYSFFANLGIVCAF